MRLAPFALTPLELYGDNVVSCNDEYIDATTFPTKDTNKVSFMIDLFKKQIRKAVIHVDFKFCTHVVWVIWKVWLNGHWKPYLGHSFSFSKLYIPNEKMAPSFFKLNTLIRIIILEVDELCLDEFNDILLVKGKSWPLLVLDPLFYLQHMKLGCSIVQILLCRSELFA